MLPGKVTLKVVEGNLPGEEFVFTEDAHCIIGRAADCDIQLPWDYEHSDVSRHHCVIELMPPRVRIRDLGSANGTRVNGKKIGQRPKHLAPEAADLSQCPAYKLRNGDEIKIGQTVFRIAIENPVETLEDTAMTCWS